MPELLARAQLFVGVDTIVSHLAAAAGISTVVLFGPEDPAIWGPWPSQREGFAPPRYNAKGNCYAGNVAILHSSMPCVPCRQLGCENRAGSRSACLDEIQADQVLGALAQVTPASGDGH
jgi:heptosyltransferase-3